MPNWCYNRIEICADNAEEIVRFVGSDETAFDFEKIVPMPAILKHTTSGYRKFEIEGEERELRAWWIPCTGDFAADHKAARPFTQEEEAELAAIGYSCWYDWALANWGTKWNTSHADMDSNADYARFEFNTAWSPPEPVIEALREKFPEAHITAFYDEPGMCVAGYY